MTQIGFLGPAGTFAQEALFTQPDLGKEELVPYKSMPDVLVATESGEVDFGFVALENAIEGTVNVSLDALIFDRELLIQREIVVPVHLNVMGVAGSKLKDVKRIISFPHAPPQCRAFLLENLPDVEIIASNSTADAALEVQQQKDPLLAAIANAYCAELYNLEILAPNVEDHHDNATRFVLVGRGHVPEPTGHDKTSIVWFQREDAPGSLHAILGEFSARAINLTKLESRPTKASLGDYCFIIDLQGHIADEVVADCLRELHMLGDVKYLGSYPAAGEGGDAIRREADARWRDADDWIANLRKQIGK
jgi:prephenate dehydratase